jgi:hypothetical protein
VVARQLVELRLDLLEGEPDPLGKHDEGDPPQDRAVIAPVTGAGALRADQPLVLVEAQGGGRDAAPLRNLADGEQLVHPSEGSRSGT